MEPLERKSHYANIVSAFVGSLCLVATVFVGWLQWKWHQEATNGASASGGAYSMNREWVVIVLLGILFVLGLILLLRGIIYERKLRRQHLPTKYGEITSDPEKPPNKPALVLPELRPKIVAIGYQHLISVGALGLDTVNDGETAYDISIPDVKLGTSVVTFEGTCPRMANRSNTEWRVLIKHDTGGFSTGNFLREEMQRQGIGEIDVPIHYRDGNGLWYISHCRIELKVSARSGIAVYTNRQELVSGFPATAPRPYLEVEDPIDERHGKTLFHFTNSGGDVAHNIQVQPLTINHLSVIFDPISDLAVNKTKTTIPTIPGMGISGGHDILSQMEKDWERALLRPGGKEDENGEWAEPITVTYEDFSGRKFEATMELVVFPMQRLHRNRNSLQNPRRQYKTVEVRNTKFKAIQ